MIIEGNFRLTELKQNDKTTEIERIVDNAPKYAIILGYNFAIPRNARSILRKAIDSSV
jgi:hypothetical protein